MKFRKLKKKLAEFGINWDSSLGKGSHGAFVGRSHKSKTREVYPVPKEQQGDIQNKYLKPLLRAFELDLSDLDD